MIDTLDRLCEPGAVVVALGSGGVIARGSARWIVRPTEWRRLVSMNIVAKDGPIWHPTDNAMWLRSMCERQKRPDRLTETVRALRAKVEELEAEAANYRPGPDTLVSGFTPKQSVILRVLDRRKRVSRPDLASILGTSRNTMMVHVCSLRRRGVGIESDRTANGFYMKGRPWPIVQLSTGSRMRPTA